MGTRDLELFNFSRGRWGMTQAEVMSNELDEFVRLEADELYYRRDLLGFPAQTKYCFSPSGGLWAGAYRITATKRVERTNAFDSLRRGNVRAYGSPIRVMKALPDGSHAEVDVATALAEPSTTWNGEWSWRLRSTALALHRFELNGELEVWLKYLSGDWIRAYLAGELSDEGPYVRPSDFDQFKPLNNLLA